jgi:hypothetical protein
METAKKIDSKGRLHLGEKLAGSMVLVEERESGEILIRPAVVIPASEQWLFKNNEALNSVLRGLKQAEEGKVAKEPSFENKASWKDELLNESDD